MTIVTAQMSVSADGFYAGQKHTDMATWLDGPEAAGFFRVTRWAIDAEAWRQRLGFKGGEYNANSEVIAETFDSVGAYVMGRRMADGGEIPWGDDPPFRAPVFVVTHSAPANPRLGERFRFFHVAPIAGFKGGAPTHSRVPDTKIPYGGPPYCDGSGVNYAPDCHSTTPVLPNA